eukprot:COSAG02_NODE_177_length_31154_cov_32.205152_32_plen_162_part_00
MPNHYGSGAKKHHGAGKSQHGMGKAKRSGGDPAFANRNVLFRSKTDPQGTKPHGRNWVNDSVLKPYIKITAGKLRKSVEQESFRLYRADPESFSLQMCTEVHARLLAALQCVCGDVFTASCDIEPTGCTFAWVAQVSLSLRRATDPYDVRACRRSWFRLSC